MIGILNICRGEWVEMEEYKLSTLPEYKSNGDDEKVLLLDCINSKDEGCFIVIATKSTKENYEQYEEIMKRIRELEPFDDKCLLKIDIKLLEDVHVGIGLTSDLTSEYSYVLSRKE